MGKDRVASLRNGLWRVAGVIAVLALLAVVAGCGSSGSSSSSGGTTSEGSTEGGSEPAAEKSSAPGIAKAEEMVAEVSKSNLTIGVTTPLGTRPEGKTFAELPCATEACLQGIHSGFTAAASKLGASVDQIPQGGTPTEITSAWNQAVAKTPPYDGLFYGGTPPSTVSSQVAALSGKGVPIIGFNSNLENKPGGGTDYPGVNFDVGTNEWPEEIGKVQAAWVVADSEADANVLWVNIKAYPGLVLSETAFNEELAALCAECKSSSLNIEASDIGTKVPEKVVSALQRDSSINYVVFGVGAFLVGVPPALQSAGISGVNLVSQTGGPQNIEYIENGEQAMDVSINLEESGWKAMDVLSRLAAGESTEADEALIPIVVTTTESLENGDVKISKTGEVLTAPNFEQEYLKLWGK
jgi:ribose transport system substrate-binding protein